jgi:hypothetical protein
MWPLPRCKRDGLGQLICYKGAQLKVRLWREDFRCWYLESVIQWERYSSSVKTSCQDTANGDRNRLRPLVCVCQWSVKCSHDSWACKWSLNRVTNTNPVYSHTRNTWHTYTCLEELWKNMKPSVRIISLVARFNHWTSRPRSRRTTHSTATGRGKEETESEEVEEMTAMD